MASRWPARIRDRIRNVSVEGLRYRLVDAKGEVLGRLASKLSILLQGKDKPTYSPNVSNGDVVVVVNAGEITLTGRKMTQKMYYRHTGYVGNLVERTAREMMERNPTFVLKKAVERMLPDNKLRQDMMRKLRLFPGEQHTFHDVPLLPFHMPPRILKRAPEVYLGEDEEDQKYDWVPMNPEVYTRQKKIKDDSQAARDGLKARQDRAAAAALQMAAEMAAMALKKD
mmetsp:Transcript_39152/g.96983  ORF Transcript_39152/g.96983 Transcript_39152/m.96983 type:complete len:226 (-) Transcript_39152:148-825(-)|eukprot:CAMPEP_0197591654 /NCGR_PEP_ID=MMETSP1326-20131121/13840_1 /TAXON_ID=1155430 /ORGANISM="Genus nov. species nov., Strain RCC2288" /LENGTH=225 /DNA_ID=CAMNT_0043157193 /DNA_START=309 /DNA_END=986 /DNA_ORIENTATION=+